MSKSQNYIIVLGGVFFIIGIIAYGVFQFFVFTDAQDATQQVLSFFKYVIPAAIGTAFVVIKILNLQEKKELKDKTDQLTTKTDESNQYAKEIKSQQTEFNTTLNRIDGKISKMSEKENERNAALIEKDSKHNTVHSDLDKKISGIESKLNNHIKGHKQTA